MNRHDLKRFYHCDCLEERDTHDGRFYHCDCIENELTLLSDSEEKLTKEISDA